MAKETKNRGVLFENLSRIYFLVGTNFPQFRANTGITEKCVKIRPRENFDE